MRMNKERFKKIITWLKRLRHERHFDMATWVAQNECGTSYCIGGKALLLAGYKYNKLLNRWISPNGKMIGRNIDVFEHARKALGLTQDQAFNIFYADFDDPKSAAEYLESYI